jgi:hypothetical protein
MREPGVTIFPDVIKEKPRLILQYRLSLPESKSPSGSLDRSTFWRGIFPGYPIAPFDDRVTLQNPIILKVREN